jgi:Fanconi-associated nuclease 1
MKQEETEIIDLTLDDEEDEPRSSFTAAPVLTPKAEEYPEDPGLSQASSSDVLATGLFALAEDETKMTICELLECLSADELKKFAKQMKLKLNGTV